MDQVRNPFAPGAGSQPPELAGRDGIVSQADVTIQRVLLGRQGRPQIFLGLRGTGKTVLLNKVEQIAEQRSHLTSFIEAPENKPFAQLLYPKMEQLLRKLSTVENIKGKLNSARRALRSFASAFKIEYSNISLSVEPEAGIADSGNLEDDLSDLFIRIGDTARAAGTAWTLLIDELQYLSEDALSALIVALHSVSQKQLPVVFFGAGLPQIAALSGNAKSYAERLFEFPEIGSLDRNAAVTAIKKPIESEGESITDDALQLIIDKTGRYPFFLQEWGYQSWNVAASSPIGRSDVERATEQALRRLDESFFRVRFDRLTPKERNYVFAMARLGQGPYRSPDVADELGESLPSLGPCRASIIKKGMIYSPSYGDIAFTVPMFEEYLMRQVNQPV